MARSTTPPRTEIPTREASDPPDDVDIWQRWMVGIGHGQPRRGADADFRYGSHSDLATYLTKVRSIPKSRHSATIPTCPFGANNGSSLLTRSPRRRARSAAG